MSQRADEEQLTNPTQHRVSDLCFARLTSSHIWSIPALFHLLTANSLSLCLTLTLSLSSLPVSFMHVVLGEEEDVSEFQGKFTSPGNSASPSACSFFFPPVLFLRILMSSPPPTPYLKWWQVKCNILSQVWVRREPRSLRGISNMYVRWLPSKKEKDEERRDEEKKKGNAGSLHSRALRPDWKSSHGSSLKTSSFGESSSEFDVAFSHRRSEYLGRRPRFWKPTGWSILIIGMTQAGGLMHTVINEPAGAASSELKSKKLHWETWRLCVKQRRGKAEEGQSGPQCLINR